MADQRTLCILRLRRHGGNPQQQLHPKACLDHGIPIINNNIQQHQQQPDAAGVVGGTWAAREEAGPKCTPTVSLAVPTLDMDSVYDIPVWTHASSPARWPPVFRW